MAVYANKEIAVLREGGALLGLLLAELARMVAPGVSTEELDQHAVNRIRDFGGAPSFLGYRGGGRIPFPSTICVSLNAEVVHGPALPSRVIQDGDLVGIDIGMRYPAKGGFCTDTALTVAVGDVPMTARMLIRTTEEALHLGIQAAVSGNRVRDISAAIQKHVEAAGYSIVRDLVGHGVGRKVHEDPEVPNFVVRGPIGDVALVPGLVIAIEPMVNAGQAAVKTQRDGWTVASADNSLSAHFEHTICISPAGPPEVLTARPQ